MKVEILTNELPLVEKFTFLAKTDLICPQCGKEGLVVKYRCNGKIGFFHETSGILLACENWENCKSVWNEGTEEERFPWHTWISSFHRMLDFDRGNHGQMFLNELRMSHKELYDKIKMIDEKINQNTKK